MPVRFRAPLQRELQERAHAPERPPSPPVAVVHPTQQAGEQRRQSSIKPPIPAKPLALRPPLQELTILILGGSGVGKSTFVNAIANYIRYEELNDAIDGKFVSYIPTRFNVIDHNGDGHTIQVGESENESFKKAQSATQKPVVYNFVTDKYNVHLIDTPGIGDSAGFEQDKENMSEILKTLASFEYVNGVCLLMKSNEARLTANVQYCLNELLLRLHRDVATNFCFVFTNCRGTFFRPGDSLSTLEAFVERMNRDKKVSVSTSKERMFSFDNEAYRFVCAYHEGVKFMETEKKAFEDSWRHSSKELFRMLAHIATRRPNDVEQTLCLNQVRTIVQNLAKPIADINLLNQNNVVLARYQRQELEKVRHEGALIEAHLKIPQERLEVEELPYPRTVCMGEKCMEIKFSEDSNSFETIYSQVCHEQCEELEASGSQEPDFRKCDAFGGNETCKQCGCDWMLHTHIRFKQTKRIELVDDPELKEELVANRDLTNVMSSSLRRIERHIQELEEEQRELRQTSVYFAKFLKDSAIISFNDVFEEQVKRAIQEQRRLSCVSGDARTLQALERSLVLYREERKAFEHAETMKSKGLQDYNVDEIREILDNLFELKHTGEDLKTLINSALSSEKQNLKAHVVTMSSRWDDIGRQRRSWMDLGKF